MNLKRDISAQTYSGGVLAAFLTVSILNIIMSSSQTLRESVGVELLKLNETEGVANVVTTVVTYFRGFDTLGEIAVLFLASLGIGLMLNKQESISEKQRSSFVLRVGAQLLFPIILLFGVYVIIYGHLSPGGGFQGGVIIASAFLLLLISREDFYIPHSVISFFETLAGVAYLLIGLIGLLMFDIFLSHIIPLDVASMGLLLSGGIIPLIYIIIGIKVGSEMSHIAQNLVKRGEDD